MVTGLLSQLPTGRAGRLLAVLLVLLVLAAGWAAAGAPLLDWYADRADALERRAALARRMESIAADLPRLQRQVQAGQTAGPAPIPVFGGGSDAVAGAALQQTLQDMAAKAGVTLASTEALPPQAEGAYRLIGVRVTTNTPWPNLIHLLLAITQASPVLLVDDLQVHGARGFVRKGGTPLDASFVVMGFRAGGTGT